MGKSTHVLDKGGSERGNRGGQVLGLEAVALLRLELDDIRLVRLDDDGLIDDRRSDDGLGDDRLDTSGGDGDRDVDDRREASRRGVEVEVNHERAVVARSVDKLGVRGKSSHLVDLGRDAERAEDAVERAGRPDSRELDSGHDAGAGDRLADLEEVVRARVARDGVRLAARAEVKLAAARLVGAQVAHADDRRGLAAVADDVAVHDALAGLHLHPHRRRVRDREEVVVRVDARHAREARAAEVLISQIWVSNVDRRMSEWWVRTWSGQLRPEAGELESGVHDTGGELELKGAYTCGGRP